MAVTDETGTVQERFCYDAFGRIEGLASDWNRTFTGQVFDAETGLMLYRNRFYSPELGRFLQRDPIGYEAGDVSIYRYVANNPFSFNDSTGLGSGMYPEYYYSCQGREEPPRPPLFDPTRVYGNYCGAFLNGPGAPIDDLDRACQKHDSCLATVKEFLIPYRRFYCDKMLCLEAHKAILSGDCKSRKCRIAALEIAALMCSYGTIPLPYLPLGMPYPF